jgi:hypothetical protein
MLSPYEFWQFWRNTTDADVGRFLKLLHRTAGRGMRPAGRAAGVRDQRGQDRAGEPGDRAAARGRGGGGGRGHGAGSVRKGGIGEDLPTVTLAPEELAEGVGIVQLFVRAGLAASGKDAKRLIAEGGAKVNDEIVTDAGPAPGRQPTGRAGEADRRAASAMRWWCWASREAARHGVSEVGRARPEGGAAPAAPSGRLPRGIWVKRKRGGSVGGWPVGGHQRHRHPGGQAGRGRSRYRPPASTPAARRPARPLHRQPGRAPGRACAPAGYRRRPARRKTRAPPAPHQRLGQPSGLLVQIATACPAAAAPRPPGGAGIEPGVDATAAP